MGTDGGVEWAHLDDCRSNTTFENLVPLCREYNLRMERYRSLGGVDPLFSPSVLLATGQRHFLRSDAPLAYGTSRLACFLFANYPRLFPFSRGTVPLALVQASSSARHSNAWRLVLDTLNRSWRWVLVARRRRLLEARDNARLLAECVSILHDMGHAKDASRISQELRRRFRKRPYSGLDEDLIILKAIRRSAIIELTRRQPARAVQRLREMYASERKHLTRDTQLSLSNVSAWADIATGRSAQARAELERGEELAFDRSGRLREYQVSPWNAVETTLTRCLAIALTEGSGRRSSAAWEYADDVLETNGLFGIVLRPPAFALSTAGVPLRGASGEIPTVVTERFRPQAEPGVLRVVRSTVLRIASRLLM